MEAIQQFKTAVRDARERKGLSVREVARRALGRISTTSILNMESGHIPYAEVIVEYADALAGDPEEARLLADDLLQLAGKRVRYHATPRVIYGAGLPVAGYPA